MGQESLVRCSIFHWLVLTMLRHPVVDGLKTTGRLLPVNEALIDVECSWGVRARLAQSFPSRLRTRGPLEHRSDDWVEVFMEYGQNFGSVSNLWVMLRHPVLRVLQECRYRRAGVGAASASEQWRSTTGRSPGRDTRVLRDGTQVLDDVSGGREWRPRHSG